MRAEDFSCVSAAEKAWRYIFPIAVCWLKMWCFLAVFFSAARLFFIVWLAEYWGADTGWHDAALALTAGFSLSLQSAGALALGVAVLRAVGSFWGKAAAEVLMNGAAGVAFFSLSVLYAARFPYYRQYHSGFHSALFNTLDEDLYALFVSLVVEFALPFRFLLACLLTFLLYRGWQFFWRWKWQEEKARLPEGIWRRRFLRVLFCVVLYGAGLVSRFGGGVNWQTEMTWENSGVTKDEFLNEAILDDVQAVWRGYVLHHRLQASGGMPFSAAEVAELAVRLSGKEEARGDLAASFTRVAAGGKEPPKHIFIILSESYANWALLPEYRKLHLAEGMQGILEEKDSAYCPAFLPNGGSTVSAVTGVVTGLADANLYLTTMEESFREPYPTASAPIFERLGYRTHFWYAGPATWERIGDFVTKQGYRHFYSRGDYGVDSGNVWGIDDEDFYRAVLNGVPEEPSVHVLLNVSNHSPFTVDVKAKGFPAEEVRQALLPERRNDEDLLNKLGHFWYADRELAAFIRQAKAKYPDSLFAVFGDHADRYNVEYRPTAYRQYGIPFILTGKGVDRDTLPPRAAGSQIDVVPTVVELIAPQGFSYLSIGRSLTRGNERGVNYLLWIERERLGKADVLPLSGEDFFGKPQAVEDEAALRDYIDGVRAVSWWWPKYGSRITEREKEKAE